MRHRSAALLLALAFLARPISAQMLGSASVDASIEVIIPTVTVTGVQSLNFGSHFAGSVVRSSQVPTTAQWTIEGLGLSLPLYYDLRFIVPTELTGPGGTVPITFGPTSACIGYTGGAFSCGSTSLPLPFNPAAGAPFLGEVELGGDGTGDGSGDVIVDLAGAVEGLYIGTILLEVWLSSGT